MSELNQPTSGGAVETSGSTQGNQESNVTSGTKDSNLEKVLKEKKNAMLALQQLKEENEALKVFKAEKEEQALLAQKQHEQVIESLKKKVSELEMTAKQKEEVIKRSKINSALMKELKRLGFDDSEANREAALKLVDVKPVMIDPSTDLVLGADDVAKDFHAKYASLGFFGKQTVGVNQNAAQIKTNVGYDLTKMSKEEKLKLIASLTQK